MPNSLIPLSRLLADIEDNPIEGAKAAQKRHDGVRQMSYESSVSAGALYRELKKSKALQSAFYSLPFWSRGYEKNPKHLNKHSHQFVYGTRDDSEGKRAEDHASATQKYYDDESRSLESILQAMKNGGFDGLRKASSAQRDRNVRTRRFNDERVRSDAGTSHETASGGGASTPSSNRPVTTGGSGDTPDAVSPKITMKKVFEHLLVAMEPEELREFLAPHSKVGDRRGIMVEREADAQNGMLVWRALEIAEGTLEAE